MAREAEIEAMIRRMVAARGPGKTLCPSEIARAVSSDWRPLMPEVRRIAGRLAGAGVLRVTQKGEEVDPERVRGPIRLGLGRPGD